MRRTSLQERVQIWELSEAGLSDRQIAEKMDISRWTVRKWRRKAQAEGMAGLFSQMGRPVAGALSSFSPEIVEVLRHWREQHPDWGPLTLLTELQIQPAFAELRLPSRASIARWLKEQDLTRAYEKHSDLPSESGGDDEVSVCHEEWEMDAEGNALIDLIGRVSLVNVGDRYSRVKIISYPCWLGQQRMERRLSALDYYLILRLAFTEWGRPERLAVDRSSVFFDNRSKSPFPTVMHLWLLSLGVQVVFGRPHRPTDQAMVERMHQTWDRQVVSGQRFQNEKELFHRLESRRDFLNYHMPCSALDDQPPLVAYPQALSNKRLYRPEWEAEIMDLQRVDTYLQQGEWFRKASNVGAVSVGGQVYVLGPEWKHQQVRVTYQPQGRRLKFEGRSKVAHKPIINLTKSDLMGEMGPLVNLDEFQLALPLTWQEWRQTQLAELLPSVTDGVRLNETFRGTTY